MKRNDTGIKRNENKAKRKKNNGLPPKSANLTSSARRTYRSNVCINSIHQVSGLDDALGRDILKKGF